MTACAELVHLAHEIGKQQAVGESRYVVAVEEQRLAVLPHRAHRTGTQHGNGIPRWRSRTPSLQFLGEGQHRLAMLLQQRVLHLGPATAGWIHPVEPIAAPEQGRREDRLRQFEDEMHTRNVQLVAKIASASAKPGAREFRVIAIPTAPLHRGRASPHCSRKRGTRSDGMKIDVASLQLPSAISSSTASTVAAHPAADGTRCTK